MKKLMLTAVLAVTGAMAQADMKIGTVEMMTLVRNHSRYESNKKLLTETQKDYQKKLEAQRIDLDKVQEEGQKIAEQYRNPMLSAKAKADLEKQMMDLQQKMASGQQRLRADMMRSQQEMQEMEGRMLKMVTEDLRGSIEKFASDNGYDMILDSSAAPFAKKDYDVTPGVLKAMGVDKPKAADDPVEMSADKGKDEGK